MSLTGCVSPETRQVVGGAEYQSAPADPGLRLVRAHFKNIGLIREVEIDHSGAVVLVTGDNGQGKSTIVQAYLLLFQGGHNPDIIGPYGDKAELTLSLNDGTTIHRVIAHDKSQSTIKIKKPDGRKIPREETFLKELASGFALNPMDLLSADANKRDEFLRKALNLTFTRQELYPVFQGNVQLKEPIDLQTVDQLLKGLEDDRTEQGRRVKSMEGTLLTLEQSLPPHDNQDWRQEAARLRAALNAANDQRKAAMQDTAIALEAFRANCNLAKQAALAEIDKWEAAEIQLIQQKARARREAEKLAAENAIADERTDLEAHLSVALNEIEPEIECLTRETAKAEANAEQQARAAGVRSSVERVRSEIRSESLKKTELDERIDKLRAIRKEKLSHIPVEGVEIRDGEVYVDGRKLRTQTNRAEQMKIVMSIAALGAGELPFFVMDDIEHLNEENKEWTIQQIREAGFQAVLAEKIEKQPLACALVS